jgi:hypothetical protein
MLEFLFSVVAALRVFVCSRSDTALEVLALRQQVAGSNTSGRGRC